MSDPIDPNKDYDIIFHWGELHKWLGKDWRKAFSKDTEEITMPMGASMSFEAYKQAIYAKYGEHPIHSALKQKGLLRSGVRIAVMGFSQTCIGATVLLASKDGGAIDFLYADDGIHREDKLHYFIDFGKMAAYGTSNNVNVPPTDRMFVITHSATPPPKGHPSTTETAAIIAKGVLDLPVPAEYVDIPDLTSAVHDPPVHVKCGWGTEQVDYKKVPGIYATKVGGFMVFGYENLSKTGCTDHIYQSKVIGPRVLRHLLIPRWNNNPRVGGSCTVM